MICHFFPLVNISVNYLQFEKALLYPGSSLELTVVSGFSNCGRMPVTLHDDWNICYNCPEQQKSQKTFKSQRLRIRFLSEYVNTTLCHKLTFNNDKYIPVLKTTKTIVFLYFSFSSVTWLIHKGIDDTPKGKLPLFLFTYRINTMKITSMFWEMHKLVYIQLGMYNMPCRNDLPEYLIIILNIFEVVREGAEKFP